MEGNPFNLFGDPDELRARLEEMAEQAQSSQRVAWADNAIRLAVEMTVAAINRLDLTGGLGQNPPGPLPIAGMLHRFDLLKINTHQRDPGRM